MTNDGQGLAALALRGVYAAVLCMFIRMVRRAMASTSEMRSHIVVGRLHAKRAAATPTAKELRAILPQPAFLQLVDALLEAKLVKFFEQHFPAKEKIHIGATRGSRVMDIAHTLSLVLEKSGDRRSRGAVTQFDLAT